MDRVATGLLDWPAAPVKEWCTGATAGGRDDRGHPARPFRPTAATSSSARWTRTAGVITVSLVGACGTCPASTDTLKAGIERIMKDRVDGITEVVAV